MPAKSTSPRAAELLAGGWVFDDTDYDEFADITCTNATGCTRRPRWSHRHVRDHLCLQHAVQAMDSRKKTGY